MLDVEHALVRAYGWSLYDIDRTAVDSLLAFVLHTPAEHTPTPKQVYCDQVSWL